MRALLLLTIPLVAISSAAHANSSGSGADSTRTEQTSVVIDAAQGEDTTELEFSTGADYSVGHYGALTDTTVWSVPLDIKLRAGRFRVQASLPYVSIDGPGQLVGGVIVSAPGSTATVSRSGIGDLSLSAGLMLNRENGTLPAIELGGSAKVPTAAATIGTGEVDYSASISVYKSLNPKVMLFGSFGYSWLGSPAAYTLENGMTASGGINLRPAASQNYGVSVAWREPVAAGLEGQAVVSPYLTYRIDRRFGLTLYGMAGLNDASPRLGAGIRLSIFQ
jgi:Putative MetA-pathway of phenol degradation